MLADDIAGQRGKRKSDVEEGGRRNPGKGRGRKKGKRPSTYKVWGKKKWKKGDQQVLRFEGTLQKEKKGGQIPTVNSKGEKSSVSLYLEKKEVNCLVGKKKDLSYISADRGKGRTLVHLAGKKGGGKEKVFAR